MLGFVFPNEFEVQWSLLIVIYPYITGLVAGAFIVSALYQVFGITKLKPVARLSLLSALAFLIVAPMPLMLHLGRPERGVEILFTPNPTSAMAGFGYIYLFYMILVVSEIWLEFRRDIVFYAKSSGGLKRIFYSLLALGVLDLNEKSLHNDEKVIKILSAIGIPSAVLLHGYVGFLFGAIKANPWWSTPLMPVIFLMSAIVSGIALQLVLYLSISKIRHVKIDYDCVTSLLKYVFFFLVIDISFETLEIVNMLYEAEESWPIISQLLTQHIPVSYFGIQITLGTFVPLSLIGMLLLLKAKGSTKSTVGALSAILILIGIFAMRWNVVIGGQLISKSLRGFVEYVPLLFGREGVLVASGVMVLPFILLTILIFVIPPWKDHLSITSGTSLQASGNIQAIEQPKDLQ